MKKLKVSESRWETITPTDEDGVRLDGHETRQYITVEYFDEYYDDSGALVKRIKTDATNFYPKAWERVEGVGERKVLANEEWDGILPDEEKPKATPQPTPQKTKTKKIVVTRHPALVQFLHEMGIVRKDVEVLTHVENLEQIRGAHVFGVLPLHLAAEAACITEVPLALTQEDRGKELSLERIREIAQPHCTYIVQRVE